MIRTVFNISSRVFLKVMKYLYIGKYKYDMGKPLTKEQFILKARQVHGWKYDYSKVDYKDSRTKICIICPIHGEFWQLPSSHLCGNGCIKCRNDIVYLGFTMK